MKWQELKVNMLDNVLNEVWLNKFFVHQMNSKEVKKNGMSKTKLIISKANVHLNSSHP